MKVSLITIARNAEKFIERTLKSVLAQTYADIEYLVIDGASTDSTVAIANRYSAGITRLVSEQDAGISDAWNKGLRLVTGDVVGLLNAGDEYMPDTVATAVRALSAGTDVVFGNTRLVDEHGTELMRNVGRFHPWRSSGGLGLYHPSVFARKGVYDEVGGFSTKLRYAMDTDWLLRAYAAGKTIRHADLEVRMLDGGVSVASRFAAYGEYLQTLRMNGFPERTVYLSMLNTGARGLLRQFL